MPRLGRVAIVNLAHHSRRLVRRRLPELLARRGALFFFLLLAQVSYGGKASWQIESVAISPDGKLIAIDARRESTSFIYKVSVDSGIANRLTNAKEGEESSPAFAPDGKLIAYSFSPGSVERSQIIIVNVDGSDPRRWSPSGVADLSPVFSPDDKTIVFSRAKFYGSYSPIAQPHPHDWYFYASDLDGTNVRQLTTESFYMVSPASVSSDGKNMVVVTEGAETSPQIAIYSIAHSGPPVHVFRPHVPNEIDHKNPIFAYPNFLPNGSILFMAADKRMSYDVYRLNPGTGEIEKLTNENGYATGLQVSADGNTAVFLKWRLNWLGDVKGCEVRLLDMRSRTMRSLTITGLP
jgi:Tol biopolymer transport system component